MPREKRVIEDTSVTITDTDTPGLPAMVEAANALAAAEQDAEVRTKELAKQLGYQGSLHPDVLENSAADAAVRASSAIAELGAYLLLMRERCPHGDFLARLDRLNINHRAAQRHMQVTLRFANTTLKTHFDAIGKTKLLEMVVLDNDEIEQLASGESIRGVTLDEIEKLSVKELRARLRKTEADYEAQGKLLASKDAKINSLTVSAGKKVAADTDWPDALIPLCDQIAACKREIDHAFSKLETARITVLQLEMPEDQRPKFEAALRHVAEVYAAALSSAERNYLKDQVVFAQTLGSFLDTEEV